MWHGGYWDDLYFEIISNKNSTIRYQKHFLNRIKVISFSLHRELKIWKKKVFKQFDIFVVMSYYKSTNMIDVRFIATCMNENTIQIYTKYIVCMYTQRFYYNFKIDISTMRGRGLNYFSILISNHRTNAYFWTYKWKTKTAAFHPFISGWVKGIF